MHKNKSDCILSAFQIFGLILVAGPNVFVMLKTFEEHSELKNIWSKATWSRESILYGGWADTNKNARFGSILYPVGNIPAAVGTFVFHSKLSSCILFAFLDVRTIFGGHFGNVLTFQPDFGY